MLVILMISYWDADGGNSDYNTDGDNGNGMRMALRLCPIFV